MKKLLTIFTVVLLIAVVSVSTGAQSQYNPSESDFDFTVSRSLAESGMKKVNEPFIINYSIKPTDIVPLNNNSSVSGLKPIGITDRTFEVGKEYEFDSTVTIDFPETKNGKPSFQNLMISGVKDTYTIDSLNNLPDRLGPWSGSHGNGRTKWVEGSVEHLEETGQNLNLRIPVVEIDGKKNKREYEFKSIGLFDLYLKDGNVWGKFKGYYLNGGLTLPDKISTVNKLIFSETFPAGLEVEIMDSPKTVKYQRKSNGETVVSIDFEKPSYSKTSGNKYKSDEIRFSAKVTPIQANKKFNLSNSNLSHGSKKFLFPAIEITSYDVGISVSPNMLNMIVGDEKHLNSFDVNIQDPSGKNKNHKWLLVGDSDVIKLESNKIVALKAGEATLSVVAEPDSSSRALVTIKVTDRVYPLTGLSFKKKNYPIKEGSTENMYEELIFNPSNATNKEVTWKSSNEEMMKVDKNGVVTTLAKGHVQLSATSKDGNIVAVTDIVVQHNPKYEDNEESDEYRW
ncbi:Ig-like domain-containing protein [Bacillus tianshenii]|uniref:Ig-like domain-containing protein n=1 Tax=Sutcliffiella tianshenii TaxID=1463404 RepID=UPI001CD29236|nr:Ig-like domain-containing protein [Bacillus tianshenii]MCA1318739.1 Ig-like domain-containing protein [Bacillus tianshenii]